MLILAMVINTATVSTLYIVFFSCVDIFCPSNNKPELMPEYMSLNRAPSFTGEPQTTLFPINVSHFLCGIHISLLTCNLVM